MEPSAESLRLYFRACQVVKLAELRYQAALQSKFNSIIRPAAEELERAILARDQIVRLIESLPRPAPPAAAAPAIPPPSVAPPGAGPAPEGTGATGGVPTPVDDLLVELRKNRQSRPAALVEFMRDRKSATFQEIAHHVHDDGTISEGAIKGNVSRTNEQLEAMRQTLRFRVGSAHVIKDDPPA